MTINMNDLISHMATHVASVVEGNDPEVRADIYNILKQNEGSLTKLIIAREQGDISQEEFDIEIEREKTVIKKELISLEIMGHLQVQKVVNAAMATALKTVN